MNVQKFKSTLRISIFSVTCLFAYLFSSIQSAHAEKNIIKVLNWLHQNQKIQTPSQYFKSELDRFFLNTIDDTFNGTFDGAMIEPAKNAICYYLFYLQNSSKKNRIHQREFYEQCYDFNAAGETVMASFSENRLEKLSKFGMRTHGEGTEEGTEEAKVFSEVVQKTIQKISKVVAKKLNPELLPAETQLHRAARLALEGVVAPMKYCTYAGCAVGAGTAIGAAISGLIAVPDLGLFCLVAVGTTSQLGAAALMAGGSIGACVGGACGALASIPLCAASFAAYQPLKLAYDAVKEADIEKILHPQKRNRSSY